MRIKRIKMESLCLTWIENENRYRVTILPYNGTLITEYVENMHEFINLMQELETIYNAT
jgi:hypothetical protein